MYRRYWLRAGGFLWRAVTWARLSTRRKFSDRWSITRGTYHDEPSANAYQLIKGIIQCLKGSPYNKAAYEQTFQLLYELFRLARREGMLALEAHIGNPHDSSIFQKYPKIHADHHATEFIQGAFGPLIDGSVKPEELGSLLELEIRAMHDEHHAPVAALSKTADALPGFGIVAAVLGIVITMETSMDQ